MRQKQVWRLAVKQVAPTPRCNLKVIEEIWRLKTPRKRTCEHPRRLDSAVYIFTDQESKPVSRPCGASPQFTSTPLILADTEITLQDVPNRAYTLRLFVESAEREVRRKDNHTWTPAQRPYVPYFPNMYTNWWMCVYRGVSPTSQIRAEVQMKSGHSFWARYREAGELIELDGLFSDYWSSSKPEFTVLSQSFSPTSPHRSN